MTIEAKSRVWRDGKGYWLRRVGLGWLLLALMLLAGPAWGQQTVLGKTPEDKALAGFFAQNGNANAIVAGVNANATTKLASGILDGTFSGKIFTGTFDGTNRFLLRTWDTNLAVLQVFEFTLNTNKPVSTNVVSRVGNPEDLSYKTLENWRLGTNGSLQSGVAVAKGSSYGMTVAGVPGTNRWYLQNDWNGGWGTLTNWVETTEGVVTSIR